MAGRVALRPGEAGAITCKPRGKKFRARAHLRLFSGEYVQASATGADEAEARRLCEQAIRDRLGAATGDIDLRPDDRVGKAARQFIDQCRAEQEWPNPPRRPATVDEYERVYRDWVHPHMGNLRLREVNVALCQRWVNIITEVNLAKTGKVRSVLQACTVLSLVLGRAMQHDALRVNPMAGVTRPTADKKQPVALDAHTIGRLRAAVRQRELDRIGKPGPKPSGDLACVVDVLLGTGARIGEVMALRWGDVLRPTVGGRFLVTFAATMTDIKGQGTVYQPYPKTQSSDREVVLPPFVVEALLTVRPADARPEDFVFVSRRHARQAVPRPRTTHNVRTSLRAALDAAGLRNLDVDIHPHLLRSTAATWVARERKSVEDAARLLGHKVTGVSRVTVEHYIERVRLAPDVSAVLQTLIEASEVEVPLPSMVSVPDTLAVLGDSGPRPGLGDAQR